MYSTTSNAIRDINAWLKKLRGDSRALGAELKENLTYLELVVKDDVPLDEVIDHISVASYKRLANEGFNFNTLKLRKIRKSRDLEGTDLAAWQGKTTAELVESIYDKIIDLKIRYPRLRNSSKYRWHIRARNIMKRIHLLLRHVRS